MKEIIVGDGQVSRLDWIFSLSMPADSYLLRGNTRSQPCLAAVSLQPKRTVIARITAASFDSKGGLIYEKTTGRKELRLTPDEQSLILSLDGPVRFPLYISVNMALVN